MTITPTVASPTAPSTTRLQVDVWSDVACPWCFIGKRRFAAALEQFEHPVVIDRSANQSPADERGQMVVTDTDRVGVAMRTLRSLGGGPHTDTGYRAQPARHLVAAAA